MSIISEILQAPIANQVVPFVSLAMTTVKSLNEELFSGCLLTVTLQFLIEIQS